MRPQGRGFMGRPHSHSNGAGGRPAYAGPGDVVANAVAWYGLRAYSAATIGNNCVKLVRSSDSAEKGFVTVANGSLDIAGITDWLGDDTAKVVTLYDQSGNSRDITQATDSIRPAFTLTNGDPSITFSGTDGERLVLENWIDADLAQPWSMSARAKHGSADIDYEPILATFDGAFVGIYFTGLFDKFNVYLNGDRRGGTAADDTWYNILAVADGASGVLYADGESSYTFDAGTQKVVAESINLGNDAPGGNAKLDGAVVEAGVWGVGFTAVEAAALAAQQAAFWGT